MLRGAEVGVRAGRSIAGEVDHPGPKGGQHDRRQLGLGPAPGRRLHYVEVFAHGAVGPLVVVAAQLDERRVADADAEDEPARPRFGEGPAAVRHRGRVAGPDVGDAAGDHEPLGRGQVDGAPAECLLGESFAVPEGAVAESLHLAHELALDGRGLAVDRTGEDPDPTGIDAVESGQAHQTSKSTAAPARRRQKSRPATARPRPKPPFVPAGSNRGPG